MRGEIAIGNLTDQRPVIRPDTQPPAPGTVPDGIAGQLMYGDDDIVRQFGGKAELSRVGGDSGPDLVQIVDVESLIEH